MVLGVFEVRVRRAESRGRDPGEPEAERPKGGYLQDTPVITDVPVQSAKLWQTIELPCTFLETTKTSMDHSDGNRDFYGTFK